MACAMIFNGIKLFLIALIFGAAPLYASETDNPDDMLDDALEKEAFATGKGTWVPVPLIVSNPTVGTGLRGVLMYLHPKEPTATHNTTTGLAGMYTNTHSWFSGLFHDAYWKNDTVRFSGFLGTGEFNFDFYGIGDPGITGGKSVPYNHELFVAVTRLQMRIPETDHWFAGMQYLFMNSTISLRTSNIIPGAPDITGAIKTAGLGILGTYDTRDNNYYPTDGQWFEAKWVDYSKRWGGDREYNKGTAFYNHYQPTIENVTLALRARAESSGGDVPFFDLPALHMGGFSSNRYRDQSTLSLHSEGRYKFRPRWGVIGFYEWGWFNENFNKIFTGRRITSYGTGIRWQVSEQQKMHLGVDAAFSTDGQRAIYVKIGERF